MIVFILRHTGSVPEIKQRSSHCNGDTQCTEKGVIFHSAWETVSKVGNKLDLKGRGFRAGQRKPCRDSMSYWNNPGNSFYSGVPGFRLAQHQHSLCKKNFVVVFLGPHLRHVEVPRIGVELELQLPAYTTATEIRDPSELCLWPIPELMAMLDLQPTEWGQGWNLHPHGYQSDSFLLSHNGNSHFFYKITIWVFIKFSRYFF